MTVAYIHGEKHDLWWEFRLRDSFRWQAYIHDLDEPTWHRDLQWLATALELHSILDRRAEELSPSDLARASLALALLPRPSLLVWEEPSDQLTATDWIRVRRLFRLRQQLTAVILTADKAQLVAR